MSKIAVFVFLLVITFSFAEEISENDSSHLELTLLGEDGENVSVSAEELELDDGVEDTTSCK